MAGFRQGRPAEVHRVAAELLALTRDLVLEAARARFEKNFGSSQCEGCTGLKAGPGVVATCYQVRQCFYTHFTDQDGSSRQERLIEILSRGSDRP